tara:strand:+ start:1429 stop:2955 length:1527 start_codon:yes stop_codon:yes gene_type:complete
MTTTAPPKPKTKKPTPAERSIRDKARFEMCRLSFVNLLDFVYVMEPPPLRGKILFEKWPHLVEMAEAFSARDHAGMIQNRRIAVLKARQLGFSWLVAAYAVWWLRWYEGSEILLLSMGQTEAKQLLSKVRFIYRNLPGKWQLPLTTDSRSEIAIDSNDSKVTALPATQDAGTGTTATLIVQDEAEKHEYLEENMAAILPAVSAGAQMIMGSTVKKDKMISGFKETYRDSPGNGWKRLFFPWNARPSRDADWYQREKEAMPSTLLMDPELYMEQEFPGSDTEALAPSKVMGAFDQARLKEMLDDVKEPEKTLGPVNIYQYWRVGGRYMCGTDTSGGTGRDYGVSVVIDRSTGYIVADIMDSTLTPDMMAHHTMRMLDEYRNPIWGIEDNAEGKVTIEAALRERYPRLYSRTTSRRGARQVGWHTDGNTRDIMWGELMEAIRGHAVTIPNKQGLDQFFSVIRNPDKRNRVEAMQGAHDDYPMATAVAWQMRDQAYATGTPSRRAALPARW